MAIARLYITELPPSAEEYHKIRVKALGKVSKWTF